MLNVEGNLYKISFIVETDRRWQ